MIKKIIQIFFAFTILIYSQGDSLEVKLKPDYRNHKNLPQNDKTMLPLQKINSSSGSWTELNPNVPKADYLGIFFIDTLKGWAVGSQGAIIYSTNGGQKWQTASSPISNVLLNVHSYNGQVVVASGYDGIIVRSTDGGENWAEVISGVSEDLWEIKMVDDTLGWACGSGPTLLRTTNAGETWEVINTGFNNFHYWALDFIDKNILYIAGNGGNILKTTNGGNDWELLQTGFGKSLYRIKVFNEERIVTGGEMGWIAYTSDGGAVWDTSKAGGIIDAMAFINDTVGYVTGSLSPNFIYKTINGGESWTPQYAVEIGNYCLTFVNESLGFSSGLNLSLQKTTDGGVTWEKSILNDNFYDVNFIDDYTGFIISGSLYKTTDGGESWEKQEGKPGGFSIKFIDSLTGFIGNNNGSIQKTTNGGKSWYAANSPSSAGQITKFLFLNNNNIGWALGSQILKTTDRGENWITKGSGGTSVFFVDSLIGWITRVNAYPLKTTDGGNIWEEQTQLSELRDSRDVYFINKNIGWVISHNIGRKLFKTTNSGIFFFQITEIIDPFNFIYFPNETHWIINGGQIFETKDSGNTWTNISSLIPKGFNKFHAPIEGIGYAIGSSGIILKYIDSTFLPVELIFFNGTLNNNNITLNWYTATEVNNKGFYVEKSSDQITWYEIGFIRGNGTTIENSAYKFTDYEIDNVVQYYKLKQIDFDGSYAYSNVVKVKTNYLNQKFYLFQNYPNPFNPETNIEYVIQIETFVNISLFDITGRKIHELVNEKKQPGEYILKLKGDELSSGIYLYRLVTSSGYTAAKKLTIIK